MFICLIAQIIWHKIQIIIIDLEYVCASMLRYEYTFIDIKSMHNNVTLVHISRIFITQSLHLKKYFHLNKYFKTKNGFDAIQAVKHNCLHSCLPISIIFELIASNNNCNWRTEQLKYRILFTHFRSLQLKISFSLGFGFFFLFFHYIMKNYLVNTASAQ